MRSVWASLPQHHWLLLAMLFLEAVGEDLLFDPDWGFESYEITIPKVLSFRKGAGGVDSPLSYLLQIKGKDYVVHLRPKKLLLPRHLTVFSFTQEGSLIEDYPHIPDPCNYVGSVEGFRETESTLSTCMGGLRGVLNINFRYYQIEPLRASSNFEHVVYLLTENTSSNETCGVVDEETSEQRAKEEELARIHSFHQSYKHQRYVELIMVFDSSRFSIAGRNITRMIEDAILSASIVDTYFQDISLKIQLKALEIWPFDRILLNFDDLNTALVQFLHYKRDSLHGRIPHDWAHLYLGRRYNDAYAWSWGRTCEEFHAGSVTSFLNVNILGPSTWMTHEMGHGVGMPHDEEFCQCRGRKNCIMGTGRTGFSNCSYHHYFLYASYKIAYCLSDFPKLYKVDRCGNKIVESREECDCGSEEDCKEDPCCGPDCRWKEGVNCSSGLCCQNCNFLPSGYVCREEANECDLAEYCDGLSGLCPKDYYKQDGTPCGLKGFCYHKGCRSRYMQCQAIFGHEAKEAPPQCYDAINMLGDQTGNCGMINSTRYIRCHRDNTICGRLQCTNVKALSKYPDHTLIVTTYLKRDNLMCWGTAYHGTMTPHGVVDIGDTNEGTTCGLNHVCIKRTCVDYATLQFDCLPEKCNGRGACNNRKNCHCMYGWKPPFCVEVGYGGSIDSGPPGLRILSQVPKSLSLYLSRTYLLIGSVILVCFGQLLKNLFCSHLQKTPS